MGHRGVDPVRAAAMMGRSTSRTPLRAIALGATLTVSTALPVFLTGSLAVQLMRELAFSATGLGAAVALFRVAGITFSPRLGRVADRLGAGRSIMVAASVSALASFGIAVTASRWWVLAAWLVVAGGAQALGQPAANRLLSSSISPARLGTAFGLKQSAPPAASMLAGFAVPVIALTVGWRWSFVLAGLLALTVLGAAARGPRAPPPPRGTRRGGTADAPAPDLGRRRRLLLLALAFGLGTATSSVLTTFFVDAAVVAGMPVDVAGLALSAASLVAIVSRVTAGITSDRLRHGHLHLCAGLLGIGTVGLVLLIPGDLRLMPWAFALALAGTWGFNGVFWFALVRAHPASPGSITGAVAPGGLIGAMMAPLAIGWVVDAAGYSLAWALTSLVGVLAVGAMMVGARQLREPGNAPRSK